MVTPKPPLQMFQYDFDVPTVFLLCELVNLTLIQIFYLLSGLLIFRAVAHPRNSGLSAKYREIPKKTRNTAKSARNISKYMSAKRI